MLIYSLGDWSCCIHKQLKLHRQIFSTFTLICLLFSAKREVRLSREKMGASFLQSCPLAGFFLVAFFASCFFPEPALVAGEGVTRHYKFNVCTCRIPETIFEMRLYITHELCIWSVHGLARWQLLLRFFLSNHVKMCLAGRVAKCDAFVPHQKYGNSKWEISWPSSHCQGRRPTSNWSS